MDRLTRRAAGLAVCLGSVLLLWLIFKFALPALAPIAIALLISSGVRPLSRFISKRSHIPAKLCGGVLIVIFVFAAVYASVIFSIKLFGEASEFFTQAVHTLEREDNKSEAKRS